MKRIAKKVLDKTSIDDKIARKAKTLADKTSIDEKVISLSKRVQSDVKKSIATAILAAFGFMIALVWRDVVKEGVNKLIEMFSMTGDGFSFTIITAFVTTVICVIGIIYFSRWSEKK
ncbi:MAG: hypothetical protein JSV63_03355 [Candidatus Aenigmatarchaeota archaeon]|nr:MAG: hypothetical protein JSV63_03355 [Candidatus Aenigmarchaeota archaeon]